MSEENSNKKYNVLMLKTMDVIPQFINGAEYKVFNARKIKDIITEVWQFLSAFKNIGGLIKARIGSIDTALKIAKIFKLPCRLISYNDDGLLDFLLEIPFMDGLKLLPMESYVQNKFLKRIESHDLANIGEHE
jgi:hypothetical protein